MGRTRGSKHQFEETGGDSKRRGRHRIPDPHPKTTIRASSDLFLFWFRKGSGPRPQKAAGAHHVVSPPMGSQCCSCVYTVCDGVPEGHVAFVRVADGEEEQVEELESGGTTLSPALPLSLPQQRVGHLNRRVLGGTVDALRRWVTHRR